jgi:Tol biopolymer transport system component
MAASVMEFPLSMTSLPVKFSHFTATASGNTVVLDWSNPAPDGEVYYYTIQRSCDGTGFTDAATVKANGAATYQWTDNDANCNTLYYRIGAADADGAVYYSTIQTVKGKNGVAGMTVSPNPVNNRMVTLHFVSLRPGQYHLYFINSEGKTMAVTGVQVADGEESLEMVLPDVVHKGLYYIKLDAGKNSITQNIVVN